MPDEARITVDVAQRIIDSSPFGRWWGFRVEEVGSGTARLHLPFQTGFERPGAEPRQNVGEPLALVEPKRAALGDAESVLQEGETECLLPRVEVRVGERHRSLKLDGLVTLSPTLGEHAHELPSRFGLSPSEHQCLPEHQADHGLERRPLR